MAIVIPFAPQRRPQRAQACTLPQRTADILFFTGVRYERAPEARPSTAKAVAETRARKIAARKVAARKNSRRQPA